MVNETGDESGVVDGIHFLQYSEIAMIRHERTEILIFSEAPR